ncbi:DEAD/DEAH box helicase [Paraglaciecola arctica]|uniref:DEAD-box ATP-dependent RNA helicase RhpA n=1 Tax=Paraglaciecola arctica BSs20135 TaxID=493475 RepID=K6XH30_9ALTE|nr:DEAD/DEAH box helicase [Paraglaciecola arctica]GAC19954.1 DEAD-box ATP-dependent RNA helicase 52C [Paraglaciecola arctica BSs20135]
MSFGALGLCEELLKTVAEQGYTKPSPIQIKAIPAVLSGRDVMAVANTGTGKTAGFTLPVVQLLSGGANMDAPTLQAKCVRALVITPTRELAAQVADNVKNYSRRMNIRSVAVFGGVRIEPQIAELQAGVDVLVATPGRLLDLYNQQAINFDQLEILVLDEADRMLDLGFIDDIHHIQKLLPKTRQTLMFSATFSNEIKSLARGMLNSPLLIDVAAANSTVEKVKQKLHPVDKSRKGEMLIHLIKKNKWRQVLVFSRTKQGADSLVAVLEKAGISAASIHANRTQHARTLALDGFKNGNVKILVATDIASRGIDVNQLPCVVNFDLPYVPEDYVHRIGRTGRAGTFGLAISLFSEDESKQLKSIEALIGRKFEREIISGFAPNKQAETGSADEDLYGNFEADAKPLRRGQSKGRGRRGGN